MSVRSAKQIATQRKLETVYGQDPTGWTMNDFALTSVPDLMPETGFRPRQLARPFFGADEELAAEHLYRIKYGIEMAGSATAGTAPPWGRDLLACGFAETVFAGDRVEYTPVSEGFPSLTVRAFDAGVRRQLRGVRGNCQIKADSFQIPMLNFDMLGLDAQHSVEALPPVSLSAFQVPVVLTDAAAGDITVGGTYDAGVITGGTKLQSLGIEIDFGITTEHYPVLGGEAIQITDRVITGKVTVAVTSAEEVALWTAIRQNNAVSTLGIAWGTASGHKIVIFGSRVQRSKPKPVDIKGRRFFATELRFLPTPGTGNNDIRIAAL